MLEQIAEELLCAVCKEKYTDPRILPCSHCYCLTCIEKIFTNHSPRPFPCPECRKETMLPSNDPSKLPKELLATRLRPIIDNFGAKKHFCFDCNLLVSKADPHPRNHYIQLVHVESQALSSRVQRIRDAIIGRKTILVQRKIDLSRACETNLRAIAEVSERGDCIVEMINASFDELIDVLQRQKKQLLEEARACVESKKAALDRQERAFRNMISEIEHIEETTADTCRASAVGNIELFLGSHKSLLANIDGHINQCSALDLKPAAVADMNFPVNCTQRVADLARAECKIMRDIPADLSMQVTGIKPVMDVMTTVPVKVTTTHSGKGCVITASLSQASSPGRCDVFEKEPGVFEFSYCATNRGQHWLHVEVNGQQLSGSSYLVRAAIPPDKLGTQIRAIEHVRCPASMAFGLNDLLVIAEAGEAPRLVVMDKFGGSIVRVTSELDIVSPVGLAVDGDCMIYMADTKSNALFKFNRNGTLLKRLECLTTMPWSFLTAGDMAVTDDDLLFVCDFGNHRIQVFDTNLNFVTMFGSHGQGHGKLNNPADIAYSKRRKLLFVADLGNQRIHVFERDGTPVEFFPLFSRRGTFKPFNICLDRSEEFLFIGDISKGCIAVFGATRGEYVTSFCSKGTGKGQLQRPTRVALDSDGYVYVCDSENHNILVF